MYPSYSYGRDLDSFTCEPVYSDTRGPDRYQRTQEVDRIIVDPYGVCAICDFIDDLTSMFQLDG